MSVPGRGRTAGAVFPLLAILAWTGNTLVTKAAATVVPPAVIAVDRWLVALAVLAPLVGGALWRQRATVRRQWPRLAVLGALGMAAYQGLAYQAATTTTAAHMAVMLALSPLLSSLFASALAGERPSRATWAGALLSLAGVVVIASRGSLATLVAGDLAVGDGLMLLAVASNALYGVLLRRWPMALTTWQQLLVQIAFGVAILGAWRIGLAVGGVGHGVDHLGPPGDAGPVGGVAGPRSMGGGLTEASLPPAAWPMIAYAGVAASLGAPYCWIRGVQAIGPARASLFMNLLPVLVTLAAWPLLDDVPHAYHALGAALALGGVWVGQRR